MAHRALIDKAGSTTRQAVAADTGGRLEEAQRGYFVSRIPIPHFEQFDSLIILATMPLHPRLGALARWRDDPVCEMQPHLVFR